MAAQCKLIHKALQFHYVVDSSAAGVLTLRKEWQPAIVSSLTVCSFYGMVIFFQCSMIGKPAQLFSKLIILCEYAPRIAIRTQIFCRVETKG
jgi:hypothetical protein